MVEKRPFRAYSGREPYIFASYSHKDSGAVYSVIGKLFLSGWNIWYDQGIPNNAVLDMEITRHISRCSVFVLFLSANSANSQYVTGKELPHARKSRRQIIYAALDGGDYSAITGGAPVIKAGELESRLPARCRGCESRSPAPIEVDMSQGIKIMTDRLSGFEYSISNGILYITNFFLNDETEKLREEGRLHIVIPERHSGFPVAGIASGALSGPDAGEIMSVTLPDSMESIGEAAFDEANFESIHLPERLKTIDADCFSECDNLKHVDLPYGLENIEGWAFWGCSELSEIIIPETVKYIGSEAFTDCTALQYAVIAPGTAGIESNAFDGLDTIDAVIEDYDDEDDVDMESIDLDGAFHIVCVRDSAAHRFAVEERMFYKLISAEEMEEKYQKPMRLRHEQAMRSVARTEREYIMTQMTRSDGNYACVIMTDEETAAVLPILEKLGADGCRIRLSDRMDSPDAANSATIIPILSKSSVNNAEYVGAVAASTKALFPLMTDDSRVPAALAQRFILHLSDRTPEDLLNELREHLIKNGCRGNPRSEKAIKEQFIDSTYDYETDGSLELTKYKGSPNRTVIIPDELFGQPVAVVGHDLFKNRTEITSVIIGNNVKTLARRAFEGCSSLSEITIPPSVETIYDDVFGGCPADMKIYAARKSAAAAFAKENGFKLKYRRFKKVK